MRLIIVSNRLPFTVIQKEGSIDFKESMGGLVSGLSSYLDSLKRSAFVKSEYIWCGWPGISIEDNLKEEVRKKALSFNSYPVFLKEEEMERFYYGFCNKIIWPLFHYFTSFLSFNEENWDTYKKVNEIFCDAVLEIVKPEDVVWVHDYHLMLLPELIRKKNKNIAIGFFLHIPFPTFEVFRIMSVKWCQGILKGLLGSDLIGFHTYDYTQYFLRCVLRILGYEHKMGKLLLDDERIVSVDTFPMGIDFDRFFNSISTSRIKRELKKNRKLISTYRIILSVDRLDYTKGIINRLLGYETFLENNPEWHCKVMLLLIVVPSRLGIEHYQTIKKEIDEITGRINGKFGRMGWMPVIYQYRFLSFEELVPLYGSADVALITPLRDGMNLIAKEYIACSSKKGVLILSEMTGAAKELAEALLVNPNSKEEIATAIKTALEMPESEQQHRIKIMQQRLKRYNVIRWAEDFINSILSVKREQKKYRSFFLSNFEEKFCFELNKAEKRVIFLDYDGTLVPLCEDYRKVKPDKEIIDIISKLSEKEANDIVIVSGRDRKYLENNFQQLKIGLIAEHGLWIKKKNKEWKRIKNIKSEWKKNIINILEINVDRLPYSFIEEKECSLVFHYRKSDPELASVRVKELIDYLVNFTANIDLQIIQGKKSFEIRPVGLNKGNAAILWLLKEKYDFIAAIGDDFTDEDLFKVLPADAWTIKVGFEPSFAKYRLHNLQQVKELLKKII